MPSPFKLRRREGRLPLDDLDGWFAIPVQLDFTLAADANTLDVSTELQSIATTLAQLGQPVPHQVMADINTRGWVVGADAGEVEFYDRVTKAPVAIAGDEAFLRFTETAGAYSLGFFTLDDAGADVGVAIPAGDYTSMVAYLVSIEEMPWDVFLRMAKASIGQDAARDAQEPKEQLAVTALNTLAAATVEPRANGYQTLEVDGRSYYSDDTPPVFTVAGTAVTWDAAAAGMNIYPGQRVIYKRLPK